MIIIKNKVIIGFIYLLLSFFIINPVVAECKITDTKDIRLYTLNCGYLNIHDMSGFSDTSFYSHQAFTLADPCFLIKHPKGWLLWDTGVGEQYVNKTVVDSKYNITITVPESLIAQLKQLGLTPNNIQYVGLSHAHFDHANNVSLFVHATFLLQRSEYAYMQKRPLPIGVSANIFSQLKNKHLLLLNGDYDVFGDHKVVILSTPGHTPGHQSLKIILPRQTVILSGDLYHTRQAYLHKLVPAFNSSRAETLLSMQRIDAIMQDTKVRLIVQHDPNDIASLPKIPNYLK